MAARKRWSTPRLTVYGTVKELTGGPINAVGENMHHRTTVVSDGALKTGFELADPQQILTAVVGLEL